VDVALVERAEPVESFNRRRHSDDHRRDHEAAAERRIHPRLEHVMAPDDPRQERDRDHRVGHRAVSEDGLAREDRDDLRRDAHRGQDHDVDLGMAEEPEQVLPQQRLAAARGQKEMRAAHAIEQQQRERRGQHRQREQQQDRRDEKRPDDQRQAEEVHALGAHVDDGRDVVDRAHQRRRAEHDDADAPQVLTPIDAGIDRHRAQWSV